MADQITPQAAQPPAAAPKQKKERSPSFPFIPIGRALERVREFGANHKRFPTRVIDAAGTWSYAPKSSGLLQTIAALKAYGLMEDVAVGGERKIQLSETAWRLLHDARPGIREQAIRDAALRPRLLSEFAKRWQDGRPNDAHCISELKLDEGFTTEAAKTFLRVYDDTMKVAADQIFDKMADSKSESAQDPAGSGLPLVPKASEVKVGDYIQWVSAGVDQFAAPKRVEWISEDGEHIRVFGSMTGIPTNEVIVTDAPKPPTASSIGKPFMPGVNSGLDRELNVLLTGGRLSNHGGR